MSYGDVYSHPLWPLEKFRKLSWLEIALLKACRGILDHVEKKCALLELHVSFAKKEKLAQLNCPATGSRLRELLKREEPLCG